MYILNIIGAQVAATSTTSTANEPGTHEKALHFFQSTTFSFWQEREQEGKTYNCNTNIEEKGSCKEK